MLKYILAHPGSRSVQRLVRRFSSYKRLVLAYVKRISFKLDRSYPYALWLVRFLVRQNHNKIPSNWLCRAAYDGRINLCRFLLCNKIIVESVTGFNWTALHAAADSGHAAVCRTLLASGASVNNLDNDGCGPLHVAIYEGRTAACTVLISEGADVHAISYGKSLLHDVARYGKLEIAKLLVNAGITLRDPSTDEPYFEAAYRYGNYEVGDFLRSKSI